MRSCWVCGSTMSGQHAHHVLPRSDGGAAGPLVDLCANCHNVVHNAVRRMVAGGTPDAYLAHLREDARERAMGLIGVALAAARLEITNPHPALSVTLASPLHMRALDLFKTDRGFTSREAAINALLWALAGQYGLHGEDQSSETRGRSTTLGAFRRGGLKT